MGTQSRSTLLRFALSFFSLVFCGSGLASTVDLMGEDPSGSSSQPEDGVKAASELYFEQVRTSRRRQAAEAAFNLSLITADRKDFNLAQRFIEEALLLNPDNADYLRAAAGYAFKGGDYASAEAYQLAVVEIAQSSLNGDDLKLALVLDELGIIYLAQNRYSEAEELLERSLVIQEQALGTIHPSLARGLNDLAGLAMKNGRFDDAEQRLKRALHLLETGAGADARDTAMAMHNLGDFYSNQKRFSEAAAMYRRTAQVWEDAPAQDRLELAVILNELGSFYGSRKRLDEAKPQFELVVILLSGDFGQDHPQVRIARAGLEAIRVAGEKRAETIEFSQQMFDEIQTLVSGLRMTN
ncbi:MAG: tetratricopeptide repeat protein [Thiogranum sp.]|nr:tetratricopeptide repeat protein [Thiogranum sp.]